jgi:hypothetical protein
MTQHEVDEALAEHRAVMAAHYRECVNRPTAEQYESQLNLLRQEMGKCVITTSPSSSHSLAVSSSES